MMISSRLLEPSSGIDSQPLSWTLAKMALMSQCSGMPEVRDWKTIGVGSESLTSTILWMVQKLCTALAVPLVSFSEAKRTVKASPTPVNS